ncbi:MAG: hypothetical protein NZ523_06170 [Elioraea sp.]|nr:hypothetical protein [Elioraea sp.]MDW8445366.1 hypothetical protein [Acetobacteraceae bacterium]
MSRLPPRSAEPRVWIAFSGRADLLWQRLLCPGFRHCFAALADPQGWTVVDPLAGRVVVERLAVAPDFDLPEFWRRAGFRVLGPFIPAPPRRRLLPLVAPFTCVTVCLRLLGREESLVLTPRGLYRRLAVCLATSDRKKVLTPKPPAA